MIASTRPAPSVAASAPTQRAVRERCMVIPPRSPVSPLSLATRLRLRAVVAFDDEKIGLGLALAQRRRRLVLGRTIAVARCLVAGEFEHHRACARLTLHQL